MNWKSKAEALAVIAAPVLVGVASALVARAGRAKSNPLVRSWFGEPERHAAAARKGWTNRRRAYPRSWDEV